MAANIDAEEQDRKTSASRETRGRHADSTVQRGWKIGLAVVAIVAGALTFWFTAQVLLVFFFAAFLAVFFSGLARTMQKYSHFNYRGALMFVLLAIAAIFIGAGFIIGPAVADQSANLSKALPQAFNKLVGQINTLPGGASVISAAKQALSDSKDNNIQNALKFAGLGVHGLGGLIFAVVIGIFFASDPELYQNGFLALFPPRRRERMREVLDELGFTLWWWLLAQLATMATVGILIGVGLTVLDVPLSGTLGLLAALLSFIPSLGPFISVIPAVMLGLTISPMMGLWVCLLFLAVQTLEANVITPLIQQRAISLPPALILSSELMLGLMLGGAGLAFATPLAAVGLVLVNMLYIQDVLHEPGSLPSSGRGGKKSKSGKKSGSAAKG
jgi:predicted PurR-regulated permease PerM